MNEGGYEIRESARAKRLSIAVHPDGRVVVTKPASGGNGLLGRSRMTDEQVERFVAQRREWIETTQEKFRKLAARRQKAGGGPSVAMPRLRRGSKEYELIRKNARALVESRLPHFSRLYGFSYGSISIRNQKTRWGSCSQEGNLSFNYRIAHLPSHLADYVIVHELCHTNQHNHSKRFWDLVSQTIPEHSAHRKELRNRYVF